MVPSVEVWLDGRDASPVGTARFNLRRGAVSTSFQYDPSYAASPDAFAMDPALPLGSGAFHAAGTFGCMRDSAPDRWGRRLIEKRLRAEGRFGADECDYLLGVSDIARQGALRYRAADGRFLSEGDGVPPAVELPGLIAASNEVARGSAGLEAIKALLAAGSGSLGGARPKASVSDGGRILLAKFSHPGDEWDAMAWEKTALDVADAAGIPVPGRRLVRLGAGSALVLERFDREGSLVDGARVPYMSAMTLLGCADGECRDYAEVAEELAVTAAEAGRELAGLFRRAVLSVCMRNTDDHLRNLGLVRERGAWGLSPAFDVNPDPDPTSRRATTVMGEDGDGDAAALAGLAAYCGLSGGAAAGEARRVVGACEGWRNAARLNGCPAAEVDAFAASIEGRLDAVRRAFRL